MGAAQAAIAPSAEPGDTCLTALPQRPDAAQPATRRAQLELSATCSLPGSCRTDRVLIPADEAAPGPPAVVPATHLLTFGSWTADEIMKVAGPMPLSSGPASGAHRGLLCASQAAHLQVLLAQVLLGACTPNLNASGQYLFGDLRPEEIAESSPAVRTRQHEDGTSTLTSTAPQ